jgi:hypothetical protein
MPSPAIKREVTGLSATVVVTVASVLMMYVRNQRFFYRDDVEHQHMGVFTALHHNGYGINALGGFHKSWFLSLITGEIQFGVFNPVSRVRDWIAASGDNLARSAMLIALMYLVLAAIGAYVAARALAISPSMSVAASLFCTFNVHLLYWDAGSWTPALIGFSWFTWFVASVWWTRRSIRFAPFIPIAGYLLVSAGWPHAMIAGGVVALVVGLEQLFTRKWHTREALIYTAACVTTALVSSPVWVSAQVFAEWAARAPQGLYNDGFLTHQLDALLLSFSPFVQPYVDGFAGQGFMFEPITYITWVLPLAVYWVVTSQTVRRVVRVDAVVAGIVSVGMLGPSILGPTRWPFRFQPFAAFLVVMVVMRALQAAPTSGKTRTQFEHAWRWIAPVVWLSLTALRPRLIPMLLTALLFIAIPLAHRIFLTHGQRIFAPLLVVSIVATTGWLMYASPSPAMPGDRNAPASRAAIANQYSVLSGHRVFALQSDLAGAMTIERKRGRFRKIPNDAYAVTANEMADGNIIQAANIDVEFVTGYSAMPPDDLETVLRMKVNEGSKVFGWSTENTANALFTVEPTTAKTWIELMGITAVMVQRGQQQQWFDAAVTTGWVVSHEQPAWVLYTNSSAAKPTTVSYHDVGVAITETSDGASIASSTGGKVLLARPITPGMKIAVGGESVEFTGLAGAMPMITVPSGVTGEISVSFGLPRGTFILVTVTAGLLMLIALCVLAIRQRTPLT